MLFGYLYVIMAGALNAVQSGSNAKLATGIGSPWPAVVIFYGIALLGTAIAAPFVGAPWPGFAALGAIPWWAWLGGVLNAIYLMSTLVYAKPLGSGVFTALSVTAAVLSSLALDHFGAVGFDVHALNWGRAAGAALMVGGLVLIATF